jgi:dCMP deaminase
MDSRPSWETHWFIKAIETARMSTCKSRRVGAVFVRDNKELSSGFNGVPSKYPHPKTCKRIEQNIPSGEKLELCKCAHAEANAIANAAEHGIALKDSVVYCTTFPCWICMGLLANIHIKEVRYIGDYVDPNSDVSAVDIARNAGIKLIRISEESQKDTLDIYAKIILNTERLDKSNEGMEKYLSKVGLTN